MANRSPFVDQTVHHLNRVAPVTARAMFGGYGFYSEGVMFALIAYDTLYLKVDDGNREAYLAAGSEPFTYDRNLPMTAMENRPRCLTIACRRRCLRMWRS